ncbi:hypothetical protein CH289_10265 [Rhodococcus sp. RS1C4]|uniref:excalibur calcium-binding domain-containing protein n=1 Tax=Nocardiaceae TaxID=85025 RepID=UPI00037543A1|nr:MULTISPECIES: excalibur calcium-binding domain-containing protein [Rhodococcus]OZC49254.1 hypothetical protein CH267_24080 [Rhodococcus sp. 06-621-2]OZC53345.1 hypothetical protein CH289_10265 [Rhodococcus sp. RS1C4]OZC87476.1 hypothetical protein CH282_10010 [Rhodococcus sp. 06-418-1B]OZD12438.1 hypothetical protein CH253_27560 [Rhodococcus sp. 06-156-3C]OZD13896.1 hypothetical protein CH280_15145 [Rhodococcus sp. 06-156-4C]
MTGKTSMLARLGLGGIALAATMAVSPAVASADPVADFLCNSGSSQFCPVFVQPAPAPRVAPAPPPAPAPQAAPRPQSAFQYKNCTEARDAGAAPVYRDEYGYGPHLDRDNDGIGCE